MNSLSTPIFFFLFAALAVCVIAVVASVALAWARTLPSRWRDVHLNIGWHPHRHA